MLRTVKNISAKSVFDAYKEGDVLAGKIVDKFAAYLGNALAVFACVSDPDVFVIGGGVSKAGQVLIDAVEKYYKAHAFTASKETPLNWQHWEMSWNLWSCKINFKQRQLRRL